MKVVFMSDSHGYDQRVEKIINDNKDADYFYHLGDICTDYSHPRLNIIQGNNDYDHYPLKIVAQFEGYRVLMLHSDRIYYNRLVTLKNLAVKNNCQIVLYGHTHCCCDDTIDGIRLLNPGSLCFNRDGSRLSYLVGNFSLDNYSFQRFYLE
ncbi:MAG: metallophosphoesterase family protein [Erysipelotrichaceae bacterium]